MLTIRRAQFNVFAAAGRMALAERLAGDIAENFPVHARFSGEAALRSTAAKAIERCRPLGCQTQRDAARYLLLACLLGHEFATDPRQPWAAEWLQPHPGVGIGFRLDRLIDLANEQIDRVDGEFNEHLIRSLARIRRLTAEDFAAAGASPEACAGWLASLLPGWAKERDGAALRALAAAAPKLGAQCGLTGPGATAVVALHAALLGHGFASDPFCPWVGAALAGDGADRAERLCVQTRLFIDEILQ